MMEDNTELWEQELKKAGWTKVIPNIWQSPSGLKYVGTFQSWKMMKSHPEL